MSDSLEQKIGKLNQELALLKEKRDKLNLEAKKWAEKRNAIHKQINDLRTKAVDLKEKRDKLNNRVHKLKNLREQAKMKRSEKQTPILKLKERIRSLEKRRPTQSMHNLQQRIDRIEWRIQTTSLPVKEEELLINQVKQLETQLLIHKRIRESKEKLTVLQTENKAFEVGAKAHHEKLSNLAEQSQKYHEEMLENLNKINSLKVEADSVHQKHVEIRQQAQNIHQGCMELLHRIETLKKKFHEAEEKIQAERQSKLRKELEKKALEKLKSGKKLTWEEFKILAEKGRV